MATHSSTLAWKIPWTGEPGGLPSVGSHRVWHDWSDLAAATTNWTKLWKLYPSRFKGASSYQFLRKSELRDSHVPPGWQSRHTSSVSAAWSALGTSAPWSQKGMEGRTKPCSPGDFQRVHMVSRFPQADTWQTCVELDWSLPLGVLLKLRDWGLMIHPHGPANM